MCSIAYHYYTQAEKCTNVREKSCLEKKAFELYKKAAMEGSGMANNNTGVHYAMGRAVDVDKFEALRYCLKGHRIGYRSEKEKNIIDIILETKQPTDFDARMRASIAFYYYESGNMEEMNRWYAPYDKAACTIARDAVEMATIRPVDATIRKTGVTALLPGGKIKKGQKDKMVQLINIMLDKRQINSFKRFADAKYEDELRVSLAKLLQQYFEIKNPAFGSSYLAFKGDEKLLDPTCDKSAAKKLRDDIDGTICKLGYAIDNCDSLWQCLQHIDMSTPLSVVRTII